MLRGFSRSTANRSSVKSHNEIWAARLPPAGLKDAVSRSDIAKTKTGHGWIDGWIYITTILLILLKWSVLLGVLQYYHCYYQHIYQLSIFSRPSAKTNFADLDSCGDQWNTEPLCRNSRPGSPNIVVYLTPTTSDISWCRTRDPDVGSGRAVNLLTSHPSNIKAPIWGDPNSRDPLDIPTQRSRSGSN